MLKIYFPVEKMNETLIQSSNCELILNNLLKLLNTRLGGLQNSHIDINIEFIDT